MSMSRRLSNVESLPLSRPGSSTDITAESIKAVSQRFCLEIVFKLSLCRRGLTRMSGLECCVNLVDLNLSGNSIAKIEGLEALLQLRRLNLSSNHISEVSGVWHLEQLEVLRLQDNRLAALDALHLTQMAQLPQLRALYLQNPDGSMANAVCRQPRYKAAVIDQLTGLANLDGERCPGEIHYMELAAEMAETIANPPPPRTVVLPDVRPWLEGVSLEVGGGEAAEAAAQEVQDAAVRVTKALDECQMLTAVLREELGKAQRLVREGGAAAGSTGPVPATG